MPDAVIPVLKTFPLFARARDESLRALAPHCIFRSFSAGIEINRADEPPRFIHCLRSGSVAGWSRFNQAQTIVATARAPTVFDVSSAIVGQPTRIALVTRETSETIAIETNAFLAAVATDGAVCHAALLHASRVNLLMIGRLLDQKLKTAERRLAEWILAERARNGAARTVDIVFSKRALAFELGMSPANLSRLFNVVRDHGVAVEGKTMTIVDLDRLVLLAQG